MDKTLFSEYVDKYFRLVISKITEKYNGQTNETALLHKTMLSEEYSAVGAFATLIINHAIFAADVVALDSSIPLKRRGKISSATGQLPKIGIKYRKGEKDIQDINIMISRGVNEATIASKIFDDVANVIKAIDVRKEIMFLQALSTGQTLVGEDSNDGTAIRVDYGYLDENIFAAITAPWTESTATPEDDVQQLFDKAAEDGNAIGDVYMSKKYFDLFRKSEQGKLLAASFTGQVITDPSLLPIPARVTFTEALNDEFGATFHVVNSTFKYQSADGKSNNVAPWAEANIIGVPSENVGRLVYGTLAEETNPVSGVAYEKSGSHILVSKFSKADPYEEFTVGQAMVIPVIDGADSIYLLQADQTATDDSGNDGGDTGNDEP